MSDERSEQQANEQVGDVSTFTEEQQEVVSKLIEAKTNEAISSVTENFKKELSGLNRRNGELESYLEEQKKAAMSEKEKFDYELSQREAQLTSKEQDFIKMTNKANAQRYAAEHGLPLDLLETISYDNKDSVNANLEKFKTILDLQKEKTIEEFKKGNGYKPTGGGSSNKAQLSREELKNMPLAEVDAALREGRIKLD